MVKQDYRYALDKDRCIINVQNARKSVDYFCPCCGAIMIPKQGTKRRWHFAHKGNIGDCSYETYLHQIAKKRIRDCFERSSHFIISLHTDAVCAIKDCPIGKPQHCNWVTKKSFDLKNYYDTCLEESFVGKFKADLLLTNSKNFDRDPILIEIKVSHKSTEEKIQSGYRIIEICIDSEDDIDQITSTAQINESEGYLDNWFKKPNEKIKFYNFKANSFEIPDLEHQPSKYIFCIDSKKFFHFQNIGHCLTPIPSVVENSIFRIESTIPIIRHIAFKELLQSGLGIKYCTMCQFYRMNDYHEKSICILYKSKGTKQFPRLSDAAICQHFRQVDFNRLSDYSTMKDSEYKITMRI